MKKIVLLSPAHPLRGGIAASSERLAREFQNMGHEVLIFSFSLQYPGFLFPGTTQYTSDPEPSDLEIRTIINSVWPLNWIRVGRTLKNLGPDIIIARYWLPFMGPCLGTILKIAKRNGHTHTMALVDNAIPHEKRPGDLLFTRYFLAGVDGFVVMSHSVKQDILNLSPDKPVLFNPHPIYDNYGPPVDKEEARRHLKLKVNGRYLLFFGFIRDYKGLDLLLEALADPRIINMGIELVVAGEYYGRREFYESLIKELDISDRVHAHTHFIPAEEVKYYFGAADVVVQPYRSATQSGISQIAYHFEKPMIVTSVGGLPEIVPHGEAGYITDINPEAIAAAISDFYANDRETALAAGVKKRKHLFRWDTLANSFLQLLHRNT